MIFCCQCLLLVVRCFLGVVNREASVVSYDFLLSVFIACYQLSIVSREGLKNSLRHTSGIWHLRVWHLKPILHDFYV